MQGPGCVREQVSLESPIMVADDTSLASTPVCPLLLFRSREMLPSACVQTLKHMLVSRRC
eukprot:3168172-Rhodomonas_salina.2